MKIAEKPHRWKDFPHYGETTVQEIKTVFGLYLSGAFKNNHRQLMILVWKYSVPQLTTGDSNFWYHAYALFGRYWKKNQFNLCK